MLRVLLPTLITNFFFYGLEILRVAINLMNLSCYVNFYFLPFEILWISDLAKEIIEFLI